MFEGYGLSEAPTATHCNPLMGVNKEGSIGLPLPDVECRLISLEDGVTDLGLGAGQIGELAIRGPQVFKGYWNMPTETNNTLQADPAGGGPWLFTGDIARMDEDGYFYIVDRKKELIKAGGFQVWPREIEEVLAANPKVREVGVAGIPDAYRGETVKAWIVLKEGETASEDELKDWCKDKLARFKVPTQIEFRSELPKTTVGKVLRRELVRQHKETKHTRAGATLLSGPDRSGCLLADLSARKSARSRLNLPASSSMGKWRDSSSPRVWTLPFRPARQFSSGAPIMGSFSP